MKPPLNPSPKSVARVPPTASSRPTPATSAPLEDEVSRVVAFFETLTPESATRMADFYDPHARFVDPFNDVQGLHAIAHIFSHMFVTLDQPRFVVTNRLVQGQQCFLTWEFRFCFKTFHHKVPQTILGASHLVFSDHGLVTLHRDYWDAAQELYEKLPLIGSLLRWFKKRINA